MNNLISCKYTSLLANFGHKQNKNTCTEYMYNVYNYEYEDTINIQYQVT